MEVKPEASEEERRYNKGKRNTSVAVYKRLSKKAKNRRAYKSMVKNSRK